MALTHFKADSDPELIRAESTAPESLNRPLLERFRCAESFATIAHAAAECGAGGFTNGYDRDLSADPEQAIDNLRLERYVSSGELSSNRLLTGPLVRGAYYGLRPLLPVGTRKYLQRIALRGWSNRTFPEWPVDRTVEQILERALLLALREKNLESIPFIWFWPEGHSSCAIVTHDVETEAGRRFCSQLMDLDDAFGIKASFQVVPEKRYVVSHQYLESIRQRGFEINVQDWNHDGRLFSQRRVFLRRAALINQVASNWSAQGFRGAMLYRNVDWLEELQVSYDMSLPNVAHLDPQRGGCCTVFPFFIGNLLELPVTTTQDYSLFHILSEYSIDLWIKQCSLIREAHGMMSFIIHPDYLLEQRALQTYRSLLEHLTELRAEQNTWIALPREVNEWWRQRSQMSIVQNNGKLQIAGRGSERARLAFARAQGDRVVYSFDRNKVSKT